MNSKINKKLKNYFLKKIKTFDQFYTQDISNKKRYFIN